jgi:CRP-like cAMP-binding protein
VYWDTWTLVETIIDVLFMIDLILNFFIWPSHIDSNESKSLKSIAINYLTGWFLVDLISSVPIGLINYSLGIEDSAKFTKYNKLLRMTRIPRLSRVFRIFRLIKVLKHQQTSKFLLKLLEFLQVNARIVKFFEFLFMVFLFVHCLGCFWYFSAVIDEFSPETWVVRNGLQDVPPEQLYLTCIYWALTTITTVGYGDIAARTDLEKVTAMILMICGVGFYSFTIGSLSSFLLNVESRETLLTQKMAAINEFAKETQVTDEVRKKIRQAIRFRNSKVGIVWSDKHSLFKELPKGLQFEVALSMYSGLAKESILFKDRDPALTTALIPTLFPLKVNRGEYLYQKGDYSDSLYLIATGRVSLVTEQFGIAYKSYLKGSYFGEIELFDGCLREENVVTVLNSEFFTITRNEFLRVLNDFPADKDRIFSVALKKKEKNAECRNEIVKLIRFWSKEGSVAALAGKSAEMIDDVTVVYKNDIEEQSRLTDESSEISQINDRLDRIEKCMQMILERLDGLK